MGTGSLSWADHELAKLKRAMAELDATNHDERISATPKTAGASVHPEARRAAAEQECCVNTTLTGSAAMPRGLLPELPAAQDVASTVRLRRREELPATKEDTSTLGHRVLSWSDHELHQLKRAIAELEAPRRPAAASADKQREQAAPASARDTTKPPRAMLSGNEQALSPASCTFRDGGPACAATGPAGPCTAPPDPQAEIICASSASSDEPVPEAFDARRHQRTAAAATRRRADLSVSLPGTGQGGGDVESEIQAQLDLIRQFLAQEGHQDALVASPVAPVRNQGATGAADHDTTHDSTHDATHQPCVVCLSERTRTRLVVLAPCGHRCMCRGCAYRLADFERHPRCPLCRTLIDDLVPATPTKLRPARPGLQTGGTGRGLWLSRGLRPGCWPWGPAAVSDMMAVVMAGVMMAGVGLITYITAEHDMSQSYLFTLELIIDAERRWFDAE